MTVRGAGEALAATLSIEDGTRSERDRTYYDTFDGLLHGAGLSLSHEDGQLALVERDTGLVRASTPTPGPARTLFVRELPGGMLQDMLAPIVDVRALLPLAHLHSREHPIAVLDDQRKTVVRLALEEPTLIDSENGPTTLRPRVRLVGIRGYDKAFARVREELVKELGFIPADQPLVDEAVRAAGGVPGGLPSKVVVPLQFDQRADVAAAAVLRALLEVIEANLEGTIDDLDS
jgi:hypothetical protein